jgi:hypothetical protein
MKERLSSEVAAFRVMIPNGNAWNVEYRYTVNEKFPANRKGLDQWNQPEKKLWR